MAAAEQALTFECQGDTLVGILHAPAAPATRGVLIVVGGPQYRAGSHRQFALLARHLAVRGIPALRFDYRGMGDSPGAARSFEAVDADIRCAIDEFFARVPELREVVVWGLCDAASAALFYAHQDARVTGIVLLNPWVHTEQGAARAYLRHYYLDRLRDPELWRRMLRGQFGVGKALADLVRLGAAATQRGPAAGPPAGSPIPAAGPGDFRERMREGLRRFRGRVLLVLSGNDMTAREFTDLAASSRGWRELLASERLTRRDLEAANHTFSRREWRDQVARWTAEWVAGL